MLMWPVNCSLAQALTRGLTLLWLILMKSEVERKRAPPLVSLLEGKQPNASLLPQILSRMSIVAPCGNIADISLEGPGYYIKQTTPSNSVKWYNDHFARGQNWISSRDAVFEATVPQRRGSERVVHKSLLDVAASLPRPPFLQGLLCLSSKFRNACQSCSDCGLNVIRKNRKWGWGGMGAISGPWRSNGVC